MIKPSLTNFADFIEKPKPVIPKTPKQIQQSVNWYLNIIVILVILIGGFYLYQRFRNKEEHEQDTRERLKHFDNYLQEHTISDMLAKQNNNAT